MPETAQSLVATFTRTVCLDYLLYLPQEYGQDPLERWPLVLQLHGAGERGHDLSLVKKHGIFRRVEQGQEFPFLAAAPQCAPDHWWDDYDQALIAMLDEVAADYGVDRDRVYLTGLSMGGYGTWGLAAQHPDRFAAIAPICGGGFPFRGFPDKVRVLRHVPVWAFHGAKDPVVPVRESQVMVQALEACGGQVRLTVYPDVEHDSWTRTYENPELYAWLLRQRRQGSAAT